MKIATRKSRATRTTRTRPREWFWIGVSLLALLGGAIYVYVEHRRDQARQSREDWADRARLEAERDSSMSPSEREARRVAREEAERVLNEHGR